MILETLFLISNVYWLIAFSYVVYRAVKHTYKFLRGWRSGQIKNVKLNLKWLAYLCFPFFKRYIFPDK